MSRLQLNGRAVVRALLALQIVLALVGLVYWRGVGSLGDDLPAPRPTLPPEIPRPVTLESAYPVAVARAQQWDDDAWLALASAQFDWPLEVPPGAVAAVPGGGWLSYVFVREVGDGVESLSLLIERYSGVIVVEQAATWGEQPVPPPLDLLSLPISSSDALLAAEGAGGTDFRGICPAARHLTRLSLGPAPSPPGTTGAAASATPVVYGASWVLGYRDIRDGGLTPLSFAVDAQTGEIIPEQRAVPGIEGCPN